MNGQMGGVYGGAGLYNLGWRVYVKLSDLTAPTPAKAWVFTDESMYSLNDGYLQMNLNAPDYPDVPAAYHGGNGNCLSFADGHAEARKWLWLGTATSGLRNCPYAKNTTGTHWASSGVDVDWLWLRDHSAARQ